MSRLRLNRRSAPPEAAPIVAAFPTPSSDRQCRGRTKSGSQCRLWSQGAHGFCKAHLPQAPEVRTEQLSVGEVSNRLERTAKQQRRRVTDDPREEAAAGRALPILVDGERRDVAVTAPVEVAR